MSEAERVQEEREEVREINNKMDKNGIKILMLLPNLQVCTSSATIWQGITLLITMIMFVTYRLEMLASCH